MATKKYDVMADVQKTTNPVSTYTEPATKTTPKKAPKRSKDEELRVNLLTTKEKWADVKTLAHLKQINPNSLVEALIDKELEANAGLIKKFKALTAEAQKEG